MKRFLICFVFFILLSFSGCEADQPTLLETTPGPPTIPSAPYETNAAEHTELTTEVIQTDPLAPDPTQPPVTVPPETVPETQPHQHDYQLSVADPTCVEAGSKIYTCVCGDAYTEAIDALGHAWGEWVVAKEPTYTEWGEESRTCSRCGKTESYPIFCLTKKLTNDDWQEIARLTLQYINEIRNSQGACTAVEMPGCTQYAKLRSQQMADKEKAEHSYEDSLVAANQLRYGRYIIPALYGLEGEPYYQVYGGEAVGNGYGKTVVEVARCLAEGVSNSPQHWNCVGADKNGYMSIGVTLNNGWWYCCIITSPVNLDENPLGY